MPLRVWLIGASSGIGFALAKLLLLKGHKLILSSRDTAASENLQALKIQYRERVILQSVDVRESESVSLAVHRAFEAFGGLDICMYNAAVYENTSIWDSDIQEWERMNEINYVGAVRVALEVVSHFEKQGRGHLVFNASVSSYFGLPYGGAYSAPKAALLNFCESMYPELKSKGIYLQVINHGFVKTRLTEKNEFTMPQLLSPKEATHSIYKGLQKPQRFEIRFPWMLSRFLRLLQMMPYSWSFSITQRLLK
ncbi:MAG: SDR family NAD(P)-dependent oxidoreductase [Campylobacterales bacterium]|nr:SDR family NAD(P)-dependent oxidoreductase [Campylobacterales bacterium]